MIAKGPRQELAAAGPIRPPVLPGLRFIAWQVEFHVAERRRHAQTREQIGNEAVGRSSFFFSG
ncbi:MAG: hypothetical protein V4632_22275 [Pseudomonadota bacterium]